MTDSTQLADQFLYHESQRHDTEIRISKNKSMISCPDVNQGSYTSNQITIDSSTLNGSNGFASLSEAYITVPYVITLRNNSASQALNAASNINPLMVALKCNSMNVIDRVSVEFDSKGVINPISYLNQWSNLRVMSEYSADDVAKFSSTSYVYPDDWYSTSFSNTGTGSNCGDGYCNNQDNVAAVLNTGPETSIVYQVNNGFTKRALNNPIQVATSTGPINTFAWGSTQSGAIQAMNLSAGKGGFIGGTTTANSVVGTWIYMLKIRLSDIHPVFKEMPLISLPKFKIILTFNAGYSSVNVASGGASMTLGSTTTLSGTTCPVMLSSAASSCSLYPLLNGISGAAILGLAWGPLQNSYTSASGVSPYLPFYSSRLYVPFYELEPKLTLAIAEHPKVSRNYLDYTVQSFKGQTGNAITSTVQGGQFNLQVSGQFRNIKYVALFAYPNSSLTGANGGNFVSAQNVDDYGSPFSSAPWTQCPGGIVNQFQVQIGNSMVFANACSMDFQMFQDEFQKLGALNGAVGPKGITNGLIDEAKWSNINRIMVADCSRVSKKDVPQAILVSGQNGCSQPLDFIVIVAYEREIEIDRITGKVEHFT